MLSGHALTGDRAMHEELRAKPGGGTTNYINSRDHPQKWWFCKGNLTRILVILGMFRKMIAICSVKCIWDDLPLRNSGHKD